MLYSYFFFDIAIFILLYWVEITLYQNWIKPNISFCQKTHIILLLISITTSFCILWDLKFGQFLSVIWFSHSLCSSLFQTLIELATAAVHYSLSCVLTRCSPPSRCRSQSISHLLYYFRVQCLYLLCAFSFVSFYYF
jgi:hypothetical protein